MNLTELTDKVTNILIDAPASVTDEIHNELDAAQAEAEDRYAFSVMEDLFGESLALDENTIDKPADWHRSNPFMMPYYIYQFTPTWQNKELIWAATYDDMQKHYLSSDALYTGQPKFILDGAVLGQSVDNDKLTIYPRGDGEGPQSGSWPLKIPYIKRLDSPSTASSETWFMTDAWRYLVFKAASECLSLNRDHEESTLYALKAEREFKRIMRQDKRSRLKGTTLPIQRDAGAPFNQRLR